MCDKQAKYPPKKFQTILAHKKGNKETLTSYRLVSLFPIHGKILEQLIFNEKNYFLLKMTLSRQISVV